MSIKIFNAYRYTINNPEDVGRINHRLLNLCQSVMYQKFIEFIGEAIVTCAAMAIGNTADYSDVFYNFLLYKIDDLPDTFLDGYRNDYIFAHTSQFDENYLYNFIDNISMELYMFFFSSRNSYSEPSKNPIYTDIATYYYKNYILILSNDTRVNDVLSDYPDIEDFSYQNSSDKPIHITDRDWDERLAIWEMATSTDYSKFHFSNCSRIISDNPNPLEGTLPCANNNQMRDDIIFYIRQIYDTIKSQMSSGIIDRYIMGAYNFDTSAGIYKTLNRMAEIRRQVRSDFIPIQTRFEKTLDESFECILKDTTNDD